MMAHSISDMENYFSELEDFITLSDNDKVHLFHSSMLEILILKVNTQGENLTFTRISYNLYDIKDFN